MSSPATPKNVKKDFKRVFTVTLPNKTTIIHTFRNNVSPKYIPIEIPNRLKEGQSGMTLHHIESLELNSNKYEFTNGGTSSVELSKDIQLKHAVVNIRNNDQFCFAYSIMSCLYPTQRNAERISSYPDFRKVLNFTGINFPVTIEQIPKFENLNGISVNDIPAYVTKKKLDRHANLLLIQNKYFPDDEYNAKNYKNFEITYHTWIRNLSRLISRQVSQHRCVLFFCDRCFNYFSTQTRLERHEIDCATINSCISYR
ncbi:hypothetical protein NQ315_014647 [Exocentrus adspersus]|uniref:C2H2-type domain-containing protein n=1 Tax=Exocentrus adspersus TaxID=1586481 RepID=A0AAV8VQF1_9CUCU|nr:hypothetical protein NQ315_014647 [Exocentrus adspersus]